MDDCDKPAGSADDSAVPLAAMPAPSPQASEAPAPRPRSGIAGRPTRGPWPGLTQCRRWLRPWLSLNSCPWRCTQTVKPCYGSDESSRIGWLRVLSHIEARNGPGRGMQLGHALSILCGLEIRWCYPWQGVCRQRVWEDGRPSLMEASSILVKTPARHRPPSSRLDAPRSASAQLRPRTRSECLAPLRHSRHCSLHCSPQGLQPRSLLSKLHRTTARSPPTPLIRT